MALSFLNFLMRLFQTEPEVKEVKEKPKEKTTEAKEFNSPIVLQPQENTCIVVCGEKIDIGTRVVLWNEKDGLNGYDTSKHAYSVEDRKTGKTIKKVIKGKRYSSRGFNMNMNNLKKTVTQFFLHHSGLYHAKTTFNVLHNERKLSCHFILDDDGTIYQTLDLKEKAWHGGKCNPMSVGIEIDSRARAGVLPNAYNYDKRKKYNVRSRNKRLDNVNEKWIKGYEYNNSQYSALIKLGIALCEVFPKIKKDFPRENGKIIKKQIENPQKHEGFICHFQSSDKKIDPISFDFNRFLIGINNLDSNIGPTWLVLNTWEERQKYLASVGLYDGKIDNIYGPKTDMALKQLQKRFGLMQNGIWSDQVNYYINLV